MLPKIHGSGPAGRFNSRLAVLITRSVGTMWAAYLFALIAFVSLPQAFNSFTHGDTVTGITWLSQSFLQLVLLPIIIVGQNDHLGRPGRAGRGRPRDPDGAPHDQRPAAPDPRAAAQILDGLNQKVK